MRFKLLDVLNHPATKSKFRCTRLVTRRTGEKSVDAVPCNHYCAFKDCAITSGTVSLEDCRLCSSHDVLAGHIFDDQGHEWEISEGVPRFASRTIDERHGMKVTEIDYLRDPRWRPFLAMQPEKTLIYHHPAWLEALEHEYSQRSVTLATEDADGCICGVLPLLYTRGVPFDIGAQHMGRRLTSLPRTPLAGPIAATAVATRELLRAATNLVRTETGLELQIKSADVLPESCELQRTAWRPDYVLTLPGPGKELRFGDARTRHRLKWGVNKATKLGLEVRAAESETELQSWYVLYLDVMRRNLVPPRPYRLFAALWEQLRRDGNMELLLAEKTTGSRRELIGGSVFLMCGETVNYAFTGCMTGNLTTHANDLILWSAIHTAWQRGYRYFDFGECPEEHPELVRFKTKWGAVPQPQHRYYYPGRTCTGTTGSAENGDAIRSAAARIWRGVPLRVTAEIGDWIYSCL